MIVMDTNTIQEKVSGGIAVAIWPMILVALWFGPSACSQSEQIPDKFDNAVLLKICSDGTRVLPLTDGTAWADDYRVEDWRTVC
jgi:hypothetical protein